MKAITLGCNNVGKTSFIKKIVMNKFSSSTKDIDNSTIYYKNNNITFWDVSGLNNPIPSSYFRNVDFAFLIFDLTEKETFYKIYDYIDDLKAFCLELPKLILIGNKNDLEYHNIFRDDIEKICNQFNSRYYQISCKNDDLTFIINDLFTDNDSPVDNMETIYLNEKPIKKKKCC